MPILCDIVARRPFTTGRIKLAAGERFASVIFPDQDRAELFKSRLGWSAFVVEPGKATVEQTAPPALDQTAHAALHEAAAEVKTLRERLAELEAAEAKRKESLATLVDGAAPISQSPIDPIAFLAAAKPEDFKGAKGFGPAAVAKLIESAQAVMVSRSEAPASAVPSAQP